MSAPVWLVLLPFAPSELSFITLRAAYGPTLSQALKHASRTTDQPVPILDIAIAYNDAVPFVFSTSQRLLGLVYRLVCVICTELHIDIQYDNDVTTRVVFFTSMSCRSRPVLEEHGRRTFVQSPFVELNRLARVPRAWERICVPEGELSETLSRDFIERRNNASLHDVPNIQVERLPGGLIIRQPPPQGLSHPEDASNRHHSIALGGTFDHLHVGHKLLLTAAALLLDPERVHESCLTIGMTGDELLKKKEYREELEDFFDRQSAVQDFLLGILELMLPDNVLQESREMTETQSSPREVHNILRSGLVIKYVEIFDPYGPTITDEAISALVLSTETRSGGQAVNDKRKEKGWPDLDVFEVGVLDAGEEDAHQEDNNFQSKISSTDIRRRVHQKRHRTQ